MIYSMRVRLSHMMIFCLAPVIACCSGGAWQSLDKAEALLQDNPSESLAILDSLDSSSWGKRSRSRLILLKAIALDKNHINDGRLADEMEEATAWYQHVGNRENRLSAEYYYGDQLRGAGRPDEAAVFFLRSEEEAVRQENWYMAGMAARSLFYVFGTNYNSPEELASIKRAVDYFHRAGLEEHEDDARVKMALACYDGSLLEASDSLFDVAIATAMSKNDTVRLRRALSGSVDLFLIPSRIVPDSVISRLSRAEKLGFTLSSRQLANYARAYAIKGDYAKSDSCLHVAYGLSKSRNERLFVTSREYDIRIEQGDNLSAFNLLKQLNDFTNTEVYHVMKQSALKAQNDYLKSINESLSRDAVLGRRITVLTVLLSFSFLAIVYLAYQKRKSELMKKREEMILEADSMRLAYEELASWGFASIDVINKAYSSAGSNYESAVFSAYKTVIESFRSPESQSRFIETFDKTHDSVISKLREQVPSLGHDRLMLFAYLAHGWSYTTISVILRENSKQNLYNKRQRLIDTIRDKDPLDRDLFLSFLANRPTRG